MYAKIATIFSIISLAICCRNIFISGISRNSISLPKLEMRIVNNEQWTISDSSRICMKWENSTNWATLYLILEHRRPNGTWLTHISGGVILRWKYFDIDTGDGWWLLVVSFNIANDECGMRTTIDRCEVNRDGEFNDYRLVCFWQLNFINFTWIGPMNWCLLKFQFGSKLYFNYKLNRNFWRILENGSFHLCHLHLKMSRNFRLAIILMWLLFKYYI